MKIGEYKAMKFM